MSERLYFLAGDLFSNAAVGACAGFAAALAVAPGWPALPSMLLGMVLGMLVAAVLAVPLMRYFGAMEVMVPTLLGGMLAGMFAGMQGAMAALAPGRAALLGALCGLAALAFCSYVDKLLKAAREGTGEGRGS